MASYMHVYLIDSKTKEKRYLTYYTGGTEFYQTLNTECNIPSGTFLGDGKISPSSEYLELTTSILEGCIERINTYIKNYKSVAEKNDIARKESKDMFIEYLSKKDISLTDAKEAIIDFNYNDDNEDSEYINELENAKKDFEFFLSLLYRFCDGDDFCGLAANLA